MATLEILMLFPTYSFSDSAGDTGSNTKGYIENDERIQPGPVESTTYIWESTKTILRERTDVLIQEYGFSPLVNQADHIAIQASPAWHQAC
jgi:hypothetical protein